MASDPYRAPDSDVSLAEDLPQRPLLGIIAGFIVDIGGTTAGYLVVLFVYGIILGAKGGNPADIEGFVENYDPYSSIGIILGVIGLAMSYIAGYVCAKVARARDLKYPVVLAIIVFSFGTISAWSEEYVIFLLFLGAVGFAATLMGARKYINK